MFGIGGLTGLPLGLSVDRHPPARHLLRDRPLPLRGGAGHDLRALRRASTTGSRRRPGGMMNETLGKIHFWRLVRLHERASSCRCSSWGWPASRAGCTTAARPTPTRSRCCTGTSSRRGARGASALFQIPFIFNFFWSIWTRARRSSDEPVAGHDARVGGALAAAARQFRRRRREVYRGPYEYSVPGAADGLTARSTRRLRHEHGDSLHRRGRGPTPA